MTSRPALAPEYHRRLIETPTATLASVLSKMQVTNVWIRRAVPLPGQAAQRVAGLACTLRFSPARADLRLATNTRVAIDAMPAGCIAIADTGAVTDVGVVGDVLCLRMRYLGVAALVTDGAIRDAEGIGESGLPVWAAGASAPLPGDGLVLVGVDEIVRCGGVTVCPGDVLVADSDGVLVIPHGLLASVLEQAHAMERFEQWVMAEVKRGVPLHGLYPPNDATGERYQSWLHEQL